MVTRGITTIKRRASRANSAVSHQRRPCSNPNVLEGLSLAHVGAAHSEPDHHLDRRALPHLDYFTRLKIHAPET
jgi:hypothetical protein